MLIFVVLDPGSSARGAGVDPTPRNATRQAPAFPGQTRAPEQKSSVAFDVETVVGDPVIGPSGMTFYTGSLFPQWQGSLFIGGHQNEDLVRLALDADRVVGEERLLTDLQPKRERFAMCGRGPKARCIF